VTDQKVKCPKCGEIEQVEITKTWGSSTYAHQYWKKGILVNSTVTTPIKQEIYCNTCGQVSIIDEETSDPSTSER
jgi:uncharacterized Zn finger protein